MREPTKINDGGRAFPVHPGSNPDGGSAGMSLRDWFAGQALAGILSTCAHPRSSGPIGINAATYAETAYELADAMLAAREAPNA